MNKEFGLDKTTMLFARNQLTRMIMVRREQLNTKQRRNYKRMERLIPQDQLEAFYCFTDPRTVVLSKKS